MKTMMCFRTSMSKSQLAIQNARSSVAAERAVHSTDDLSREIALSIVHESRNLVQLQLLQEIVEFLLRSLSIKFE